MADYVGEFNKRAASYQAAIEQAGKTQNAVRVYGDYERFLNAEFTRANEALMDKLPVREKQSFAVAQRDWQRYRDTEFAFIARNWTSRNFGSSAALSRGAYRTTLIRQRVTSLYEYLKNY